jgi:undecaprenyl-phosphate galactose phosphotransferase/putative colanic acid biosynthesis UDP-glucose lipid carrier transferase
MLIARQSTYVDRSPWFGLRLSYQALPPIVAALDVALILLASVAGQRSYQFYAANPVSPFNELIGIGLISASLFALLARSVGLYQPQILLAPQRYLARIVATLAVSQLAVVCILFLLKVGGEYSRGAILAFAAFAMILMPVGRLIVAASFRYCIRRGLFTGRRVVALGEPAELARLSEQELLQFGIEDIARTPVGSGSIARGLRESIGGGLSDKDRDRILHAIELSRELRAEEFALFVRWDCDRMLSEICRLLQNSPLPVRLYPDQKIREVFCNQGGRRIDQSYSVVVQRAPMSGGERAIKRAADLVVATTALVGLAPLLLAVSFAILLDSRGPIIFRQRRCGFDNREFLIFKFRTMTVMEDGDSIVQAKPADPRVTRVGHFLRRSSIDELPQLLNVIRGDMSLVGPRPHAIAHDDEFKTRISNYALRHHVKPGLTGAAQVMGLRGETRRLSEMEQRVERDLWYINNWSLTLDVKLMLMTFWALFRFAAY